MTLSWLSITNCVASTTKICNRANRAECERTLDACDKALKAAGKVIKDQKNVINAQKKQIEAQEELNVKKDSVIKRLEEESGNKWLFAVGGLVLGLTFGGVFIIFTGI